MRGRLLASVGEYALVLAIERDRKRRRYRETEVDRDSDRRRGRERERETEREREADKERGLDEKIHLNVTKTVEYILFINISYALLAEFCYLLTPECCRSEVLLAAVQLSADQLWPQQSHLQFPSR